MNRSLFLGRRRCRTGRRRAPFTRNNDSKFSRADRRRRRRAHFAARRTRDGRPHDAPRASRRALGCVRDVARSPRGGAWTRARRRPRASPRAASPPVFSPFEPSDPAAIPAPQDLAYASLAAAYGLVALVALAQLARIHARVPEYGCVPLPRPAHVSNPPRQVLFSAHTASSGCAYVLFHETKKKTETELTDATEPNRRLALSSSRGRYI